MKAKTNSGKAIFLALLCLLMGLILPACGADNQTTVTPTPSVIPNESKIDTVLLGIILKFTATEGTNEQKTKAAIEYARSLNLIDAKDQISFELELDGTASQKPVTDKVTAMGGKVVDVANIEGTVKVLVRVPVNLLLSYSSTATKEDFLRDLAGFNGITAIKLLYKAQPSGLEGMPETLEALKQVGTAAKNEGVKSMEVDKWHAAGFKGKGVKVAVIDSGFKYYKDLKGTYLPADFTPVDISEQLGDTPRAEYEVHGTGTAEIVYSLAPEATLIPIAMTGDDFQLTKAIDYAVSQNVQIVSMSVRRNVTAGDGSGPIDKKIERLRAEKGIMFIASAGNEANAHYGGIFNPDAQGFHQFLPGVTRLAVSLPKYSAPYTTPIVLNWEQWTAKDKTDLDLFAESADGTPLWSSTVDQRVRDPLEWLSARFQPGDLIYLRIRQKPGTTATKTPPRLHLFTYRLQFQYYVPQLSVGDPASSKGSLAVGAVEYADDTLAYYSSNGPLVNGTFKPEISGPTDVSSAAFQEDGVPTFGGTSAACPEVSGLAVVFKGANPSLSPDQLTQVMLERSKDLGPPGPDVGYGVGRANAGPVPGANGLLRPQATPAPTPTLNLSPDLKVLIYQGYPTPKISPVATTSVAKTATATQLPTSAPTPTAVPPTSTPIPLPTAQPLVADFRDDFKSTQSGLPNSGLSAYQNGQYSVKAGPANMTWSVYPISVVQVENFAAEVTVQGVGEKGLYGLVFWHQDDKNYYMLSLTGDGLAQISRFNNGKWEEVMPWLKITNWQASGSNQVRLVASGGSLQAFVNNRALRQQPIKGSGTGALGFAAGSYGNSVEAIFTDFRLSFNVNQ